MVVTPLPLKKKPSLKVEIVRFVDRDIVADRGAAAASQGETDRKEICGGIAGAVDDRQIAEGRIAARLNEQAALAGIREIRNPLPGAPDADAVGNQLRGGDAVRARAQI